MCKHSAFKGTPTATVIYKLLAITRDSNSNYNVKFHASKKAPTAIAMRKCLIFKGAPTAIVIFKYLAFKGHQQQF